MLNLRPRTFTIPDPPYPRTSYLRQGALLMALKYAVDVAVIWAVTGTLWTPIDYVLSLASLQGSKTAAFPAPLNLWLLVWMLPFVCAGVVLSVRRAWDAGIPAWVVVGFFLPVINYAVMLLLASWPTRTVRIEPQASDPAAASGRSRRAILIGAAAGIVGGVGAIAAGTLLIGSYGAGIFIATPFVVGALAAMVAESVAPGGRDQAVAAVTMTIGGIGAILLLVAIEGIGCLLMAAPLAIPLALLGGLVGQAIASHAHRPGGASLALMLLMVPAGQVVERFVDEEPVRAVYSEIVVEALPADVWDHVVSFAEITAAPQWYFRLGFAYPVRARIEGTGAGAVRYCEFTTGAFTEPITAWDAPRRLAFDVVDQPPPLREWSPYNNVYAPHLDGFFRTTRGEFRLTELPGGRTRLEGRTWYFVRMQPQMYWTAVSDAIVHRIHDRVLRHIKARTESAHRLSGYPGRVRSRGGDGAPGLTW